MQWHAFIGQLSTNMLLQFVRKVKILTPKFLIHPQTNMHLHMYILLPCPDNEFSLTSGAASRYQQWL